MMIYRAPQASLPERSEALAKGVSIVESRGNDNITVFIDVSCLEFLSASPISDEYGKQNIGWHRPEVSTNVSSVDVDSDFTSLRFSFAKIKTRGLHQRRGVLEF
jgi:hypothetical protein